MVSATSSWSLPRWAIVVTSFLLVISFPLFTGLAFLAFGPVPYILAVVLILGALSAAMANKWIHFAGGLVLAAFAGLNAPFVLPELNRVDHYPDYILSILAVLGGVVALVAAIGALVTSRKGMTASPARWGSWPALVAILVLGLFLGMAGASASLHSAPTSASGAVLITPDASVTLAAKNDAWDPGTLSIASGKVTKISVTNGDPGTHKFNVDELGFDADLVAGKTTDLWLKTDKVGTYQLYCVIHSTKGDDGKWTGMTGTLTVT